MVLHRVNPKVISNINLVYSRTLLFILMAHSVSILVLFGNGRALNRKKLLKIKSFASKGENPDSFKIIGSLPDFSWVGQDSIRR